MRLGFYYHVPALQKDGAIFMPGYLGCFIDSLAGLCERVVCFLHTPLASEVSLMDYRLKSSNVELASIGPHSSVPVRLLTPWRYLRPLRQHEKELDALLLRGPSPLLPAIASTTKLPTALLLVGDNLAGVDDLPQPGWRKEAIRIFETWNKRQQIRIARRNLTFVNSRQLYEELKPLVPDLRETRTTTLTKDVFFTRPDTCQSRPVRLLYTGRMDRGKGLLEMVQAVSLLTKAGEDVVLELVGWPEPRDSTLEDVAELAAQLNISERVKYLGSRAMGPELFVCYRAADIYLLASKSSFEGFPRTIWEAMASSLPVVATRVGSIPAYLEGAAELIEPRNITAISEAVMMLMKEPLRRQSFIQKGYSLALENTLESRAHEMISVIREYLVKDSGDE